MGFKAFGAQAAGRTACSVSAINSPGHQENSAVATVSPDAVNSLNTLGISICARNAHNLEISQRTHLTAANFYPSIPRGLFAGVAQYFV